MRKSSTAAKTFATVVVGAVALGAFGTSTAVAGSLITSKQIKNNTIKSKDVRDNNLKGVDIRDGSLTGADLSDGAVGTSNLSSGAVTAATLGTIVERNNGVSVADGSGASVSVSCEAGERLIGGGSSTAGVGTSAGWSIIRSGAAGDTWSVSARNETGSGAHTLFAEAYCLQ